MKKFLLISLLTLLTYAFANAQFTTYSSYDNEESAVFEVEDMESYEIKDYNRWTKQGDSHQSSMLYINAARAQNNLIDAPATIIDYWLYKDKEDESGCLFVDVALINSTPKTIKEITLEFEFKNDYTQVYDIKTGDNYLVLKFKNLSGRTKSDLYEDIADNIFKCFHLLKFKDATYKKLFYNKKATSVIIHSVNIKYADGSISTKAAIFDNGYSGDKNLYEDGPLSPLTKYLKKLSKDSEKGKKEREQKGTTHPKTLETSQDVNEWDVIGSFGKTNSQKNNNEPKRVSPPPKDDNAVFSSAAHMPSFPGGDGELMKYVNNHIIYPESAKQNNIQGKVIVQFVVTKDGSIGQVKVARSVDKDLDREAIRVIKTLPPFKPARNALGETVNVWYTLPVTFKLQGGN